MERDTIPIINMQGTTTADCLLLLRLLLLQNLLIS